jgi:hypothetical protein
MIKSYFVDGDKGGVGKSFVIPLPGGQLYQP